MPISRIDLDEKNVGSPDAIVSRILKAEPNLPIPVPIEKLCSQLDIASIEYEPLDGMEGGLVTDADRSTGIILVQRDSHRFRQRFTIGHELGHFLIPSHIPGPDGRFLCSREDMLLQHVSEQNKRARMEAEANRFASLILLPPSRLRPKLNGDPNLKQLVELASQFEVSKEAMARAYATYHEEILAVVITANGIVRRVYKHLKFPYLQIEFGKPVHSSALLPSNQRISEFRECLPDIWINIERGKRAPRLFEQILLQRNNFAMTMLWLEDEADEDEDFDRNENMTSAQRYRDRIHRNSF